MRVAAVAVVTVVWRHGAAAAAGSFFLLSLLLPAPSPQRLLCEGEGHEGAKAVCP